MTSLAQSCAGALALFIILASKGAADVAWGIPATLAGSVLVLTHAFAPQLWHLGLLRRGWRCGRHWGLVALHAGLWMGAYHLGSSAARRTVLPPDAGWVWFPLVLAVALIAAARGLDRTLER